MGTFPGWTYLWATHTQGTSVGQVVMQGDGNLVVLNADGAPVWSSGTQGYYGAHLHVQNDGHLVIVSTTGSFPWASQTCSH